MLLLQASKAKRGDVGLFRKTPNGIRKFEYQVIRSRRRTYALQITSDGKIIVRAPLYSSQQSIRSFVQTHSDWLDKHLKDAEDALARMKTVQPLSEEELCALAEQAKAVIPERVAYYAGIIGVSYGRITIRNQHTRWGSCSSQGNLNFNCLLMLAPKDVLDSVVVHELCHRKHMDHSPAFYKEVFRVFPEYKKWNRWLKENGSALQARNPR